MPSLAITDQRNAPAAAASAQSPAGPSRASSGRPSRKNTATSAATDTDQSSPIASADIPAACQRKVPKPV